ncbi:Bax inhibitor-1/YccA family protein [Maricaulis sp.]|jgi:uncharacterized protein|uniref:Bax inhibitor-1/YccA family protein n=1 Tax=Maricaulis sp. TaxID=1486257 RepID=UPI002613A8D9|nr:Bax inhibitor-1/YccA family protein [Maricaulis sp.]MDF1767748.1 Bax inhibitor-1/YccA family protein [Maricaulis sp.]
MNDFSRTYSGAGSLDMSVDAGLRKFMLGVYNKMGLGLLLSAVLAYVTTSVPAVTDILFVLRGYDQGGNAVYGRTLLGTIIAFSPLILLLGSGFIMRSPSKSGANLLYWAVVALIGAGLGIWGLNYTGESVARVFVITAVAFGGMSLFGYTTKRNMTGMGSFLIMGVIGLVVAMVVNIFIGSSLLMMGISILGVLIFAGLTAYDTQRLKLTYYQMQGDGAAMSVATSFGALNLYLNFINMFQFLMMLFGSRD